MKIDIRFISKKITPASFITLIKAGVFGLLIGESWYFGKIAVSPINDYLVKSNQEIFAVVLALILIILFIGYAYLRDYQKKIIQIIQSKRLDLLTALLFGIIVSTAFSGIGSVWYTSFISFLNFWQLLIVLTAPILLAVLIVLKPFVQYIWRRPKESEAPFFLSDTEKQNKEDDLLDFSQNAERFAERVYNGGSADSVVFGIDAPWGIGKSTFVNFCQEYWKKKHDSRIIVYKFNPLRYEDQSNLLEKFIDGLVDSIQKQVFIPEIRPLISKYKRFIRAKGTISIPGLDIEITPGAYTVDDAFDDLESVLEDFNKKVIVIVDDLDRLSFSAIKEVLFVIKKSFTLPNISYVLCYDTENIAVLEKEITNPDKITEFLEKFVNVKVSLYLDSKALEKYVSENLPKSLTGNSQGDPVLISKAIGGLVDIYRSSKYHQYLPFIGDVRKLKRLLNTLIFLEVEKTDLDNSDFDKRDLIHLLLIYINYPNIFRKIYNTESGGKRGFFSLVIPYDDYYPEEENNGRHQGSFSEGNYRNSTLYLDYIKGLGINPRFLLEQVFGATTRLQETRIDSVPEEIKSIYACFNGAWTGGRNLEAYLDLIVNLSKPQKSDQYRFYLNTKNKLQQAIPIADVLAEEEFANTKPERSHEQFWRVVLNSLHDFNASIGSQLIIYLLENITLYSFFTNKNLGVGLRDDASYFLVKLLDTVGWSDQNGTHRNNNNENIAEIAEWIFGEGRHSESGILQTLSNSNRGVMGLYDLNENWISNNLKFT